MTGLFTGDTPQTFRRLIFTGLALTALMLALLSWAVASAQEVPPPATTEEAPAQVPPPAATEEPPLVALPDPNSDDPAERGMYLVRILVSCVRCHGASGFTEDPLGIPLSGGQQFDMPFGTVFAPNLTTLQEWTDQQIENAIRYGVAPDGTVLLPPMSYHLHEATADADMEAIIAYLRTLEPVFNEVPPARLLEGLTRDMIRSVPEFDEDMVYDYPEDMDEDPLVRGSYIAVHMAQCINCHGSIGEDGLPDPDGPAAGMVVPVFPSLLAEDLANWTDDGFFIQFRDLSLFEMPTYSYQYLDEDDIWALIAWLRSQPSILDLPQD